MPKHKKHKTLAAGTSMVHCYRNGKTVIARAAAGGAVKFRGKTYPTLTAAAVAATKAAGLKRKKGNVTENGWRYWKRGNKGC